MEKITLREKEILNIIKLDPSLEQEEIAKRLGLTRSGIAGHLARLMKKGYLKRGYILQEQMEGVATIGGANVDIKGIAMEDFHLGSSNPGIIVKTPGGVARNVAENLAKLELPIHLFSVIGQDEEGDWLLKATNESGVQTGFVERLNHQGTGSYLSILNESKEQIASISDMKIMESFNQELMLKHLPHILSAKIIFIDTNLPSETLHILFQKLKEKEIPIIVDPVSVAKASKIKDYLRQIDLITPNKEEAEVLTGITINSENTLRLAAKELLEKGVKNVVITLGAEGIFAATKGKKLFIKGPRVDVIDTTGAGDAFVAGIIYGLYQQQDLFTACHYGHTMAAMTLEREETVAKDVTREILENKVGELLS